MHTAESDSRIKWLAGCKAALLILACGFDQADAAGARQGVYPWLGEIVLLRDMPSRPAVRPAPPGVALIVDPSPRREVEGTLGARELDDGDLLAAAAPVPLVGSALQGMPDVQGLIGPTFGIDPARGAGPANALTGPLGSLGGATRGIGGSVSGALQGAGLLPPPGGH
ncbi:MAG: hypothetical protein KGI40_06495 [Xanthomonadaceae bacterium]|nr:hypothetical protein [Xanthomonadaceae bacterium]MDE1958716.1 hypothetical protein [Xanthomonadaceae bacterium]MDE2177250.1 hypothetical protein [Xanthomonadaceae bacterium]MDE2245700.1 hypothetical protein [Xanthomonadaceae bacterium]